MAAQQNLLSIAVEDSASPVYRANLEEVDFNDGKISHKSSPGRAESFTDVIARHGNQPIEGTSQTANANLADYRVPVNADIGEIDVSAVDISDLKLNPVGARDIGEIGITGTGAAIANAVFHVTGKRIRNLPTTPDKLL